MEEIFKRIEKNKIIPVATIEDSNDAVNLATALFSGGLDVAEITFRTDAAPCAIRAIKEGFPQVLPGAGTVTNIFQAKEAVESGAAFIVTPGFDEEVVAFCNKNGIPVIPGVATATEIMRAKNCGVNVMKIFPAECLGGVKFLKAISGPFPGIRFVPTGGINAQNAGEYLLQKNVLAVGGSWFFKDGAVKAKNWDAITKEARETLITLRDSL